MADFTDKAQEAVGRAKEATGDLTGNDDLKAEGAADTTEAKVKQGADAVAEKAADAVDGAKHQLDSLADTTADAARQLHLDEAASTLGDKRIVVGAVVAAVLLVVVARRRRHASSGRRTAKRVAKKAGIGRALTRC
jgi:uncharacterized protein YjbJ (UPF0337 family)